MFLAPLEPTLQLLEQPTALDAHQEPTMLYLGPHHAPYVRWEHSLPTDPRLAAATVLLGHTWRPAGHHSVSCAQEDGLLSTIVESRHAPSVIQGSTLIPTEA